MILLIHAAATWFMAGLIWMVQIVHYPLFDGVGTGGFAAYSEKHRRRITPVVAIPMLVELVTGVILLIARPDGVSPWLVWTGAALILLLWCVTAFVSSPLHGRLALGFDPATGARLVATNWIRTVAWTVRGALVLAMIAAA